MHLFANPVTNIEYIEQHSNIQISGTLSNTVTHNSLARTCFPWDSQLLSIIIQLIRQCDSCYNLFTQDNSSSPESSTDFITSVWMQQHIWQYSIYVNKDFTKLTSHLSVLARFSKWALNLSLTHTICVLHDLYSMFNDQLHSAHVLM